MAERDALNEAIERHLSRPAGAYTLIANFHAVEGSLPFEITPGLVLQRATDEQLEESRSLIYYFERSFARNPYETRLVRSVAQGATTIYRWEPVAESESTYLLATHPDSNVHLYRLLEASCSTDSVLDLGFSIGVMGGASGGGCHSGLRRALNEGSIEQGYFHQGDLTTLTNLKWAFDAYAAHPNEVIDLSTVAAEYLSLREIPANLPVRFLGYFSLLESLVTHKPGDKDPTDSISRQLVGKLNLLNNRFDERLPVAENFGSCSHDSLWKKLYQLRSTVAHGSPIAFTGSLQALKSLQVAEAFLRLTVRRVIRQALKEPHLVRDLKDC